MNQKLIKQVQEGTGCIEFIKGKHKLSDLRLTLKYAFPYDTSRIQGLWKYYFKGECGAWDFSDTLPTGLTPFPLDDFFKEEKTPRKMRDYDVWYKPCEKCGYDNGKSSIPKDGNKRCLKCGSYVRRDFSDRALKVKPPTPEQPSLPEGKEGRELSSLSVNEVIRLYKEQDAAQWFDNNFDCYADTWEDNHDTTPPISVEGPVVPAMTKSKFLEYIKSINNG